MARIKDRPIGLHEYFLNTKDVYTRKKEIAQLDNDRLEDLITTKRSELMKYLDMFKLPIIEYPEFQQNRYINGRLLNVAMGLYQDKRNDAEVKGACFKLLLLAKNQERYYQNLQVINKADKILNLRYKDYTNIVRTFYNEVHRQLISEGKGYVFQGKLGWICINRVLVSDENRVKIIDFAATRAKKKEIEAKGLRVFNQEEANWCKQNNIPYDGVDCRVYKHDECWYEIPLLACHCKNGIGIKLDMADSRPNKYHGKTNEDLLRECNYNKDEILKLDVGLKIKLTLCLEADKLLYSKYIRNENQTTSRIKSINRKD